MAITKLVVALFFSLCVFLPLISAESTSVHYCSETNYELKAIGVDITPYPVQGGKNTTFSLTVATDKNLSGGKLEIEAFFNGYDFYSETRDLCAETSCPTSAGNFVISHSQELPEYMPSGSYTLQMAMKDEENHELTCITFDFTVGVSIGLIATSMAVPSNFLM